MNNQGGFTLIEILVTMSLMAILAGIAVPMYQETVVKGGESKVVQNFAAYNKATLNGMAESVSAVSRGDSPTFPTNTSLMIDMLSLMDGTNVDGDPGVAAAADATNGTVGASIAPCTATPSMNCVTLERPAYGSLAGMTKTYMIP